LIISKNEGGLKILIDRQALEPLEVLEALEALEALEQVNKFKYLRAWLTIHGNCETDI